MIRILILLTACLTLIACQGQKETVIERVVERDTKTNYGPGDIGGGNGVDGKPLESYRVALRERPEFQALGGIIAKLAKKYMPLASDLVHLIDSRQWYFVPVELSKIPSELVGVHFKTDQLALHARSEIWFNDIAYVKMSETDKINLLVHELVMGVRLLEFQSDLDRCFSQTNIYLLQGKSAEYKEARKMCYSSNSQIVPGKSLKLSDVDYANIRALGVKLTGDLEQLDGQDLKLWLDKNGFRGY